MTLADIRNAVKAHLQKRADITQTEIDAAINAAQKAIAVGRFADRRTRMRNLHFQELVKQTKTALVDGSDTYAAPSDAFNILRIAHEFTTDRFVTLRFATIKEFAAIPKQTGRPYRYTYFGDNILVRNVPGSSEAGTNLWIWYYAVPTTLVSDNDTPDLKEIWHNLIVLRAAYILAFRYHLTDYAQILLREFQEEAFTLRLSDDAPTDFTTTVER